MKLWLHLLLLLLYSTSFAQKLSIIPKPNSITYNKGFFQIDANTEILTQYEWGLPIEEEIQTLYKKRTAKDITICDVHKYNSSFKTIIVDIEDSDTVSEKYTISIRPKQVRLTAGTRGIYYALETFKQIVQQSKRNTIPSCTITDAPRFAYRGMHLDVGRHFQPIAYIKKYIDYLATYKFNTFHWHLTEDQGWRIEIKKYPKLTVIGAWRNGTIVGRYPGTSNTNQRYGGFYTQAEIKEVVQYAKEKNITIVPEIELPGHSSAAIAAYPELSCFPAEPTTIPGNYISDASKKATGKLVQETWGVFNDVYCPKENTFKFIEDVLDEVCALFPSKYIHIGGDECPKENWKRCTNCQNLIKEKGLKDEHGLQSYFIQRIEKYLNSKGRTIIGWDEILEGGLAPNATVMSWRGEAGGIEAAKQNHTVIMTPGSHCYFDHSQSRNEDSVTIGGFTTIEKVYSYEPVPKELNAEQAKYVLGAQGNVWTEYMTNSRKIEYQIFPRIIALSEVLWSDKTGRSWEEFLPRLLSEMQLLEKNKVPISKALFEPKVSIEPADVPGRIKIVMTSNMDKDTLVYHNGKRGNCYDFTKCPKEFLLYTSPFEISETKHITLANLRNVEKLFQYQFNFNVATGHRVTANTPSKRYSGNGGVFGLVNGIKSEKGMQSNEWFGWAEGQNAEIQIDLGADKNISKVKIHYLSQEGSWIYAPTKMEIEAIAEKNIKASKVFVGNNIEADKNGMHYIIALTNESVEARYLNIKVTNYGAIPTGKPGAGNKAWLFIDEVIVH
jgi:hexosaminidase